MSLRTKLRGIREVWTFDNRIWLTFTKTFFRNESLQIYRYKNAEILTDHAGGDANGAREVLSSPMYKRFLPKMRLDKPANVLDLGASNGGFPLLLATSHVKLKKVVSVEFNPHTFVRLQFNLLRNLDCEVVPMNAALCGHERMMEMAIGKGSVSDSIYADSTDSQTSKYQINGFSLDHFCSTYFPDEVIDICKIDVEDAEFEVFTEPHHSHLSRCRYLIMEIHERGHHTKEEIIPVIEALGLILQEPDADADPTVHFFINSKLL